MEIDVCFHNSKQRFNSSEGFCYSSSTETSLWFLWSTSDALLQSIKSRLPPALSWMHHMCGVPQSRCSERRTALCLIQSGQVFLGKCFPNDVSTPNHCAGKSLDLFLLYDLFILTDWFLICHCAWFSKLLDSMVIIQT